MPATAIVPRRWSLRHHQLIRDYTRRMRMNNWSCTRCRWTSDWILQPSATTCDGLFLAVLLLYVVTRRTSARAYCNSYTPRNFSPHNPPDHNPKPSNAYKISCHHNIRRLVQRSKRIPPQSSVSSWQTNLASPTIFQLHLHAHPHPDQPVHLYPPTSEQPAPCHIYPKPMHYRDNPPPSTCTSLFRHHRFCSDLTFHVASLHSSTPTNSAHHCAHPIPSHVPTQLTATLSYSSIWLLVIIPT